MNSPFSTHRPVVMGTDWMITADHPLAAQAGAAVLKDGGNAVDAAVAANLVMAVVRPHMCGLGGDLIALIYSAASGKLIGFNATGTAPDVADLDFYAAKGMKSIPKTGLFSATVPGAVDGWQTMVEKYGTMGLDTLIAPAIDYAENGFPMYQELIDMVASGLEPLSQSPAAMEVFMPGGKPVPFGRRFIQAKLASTLKAYAEGGKDAFYRGPLGQALVTLSESQGGWFTMADLDRQRSFITEVVSTGYRGYEIATMPPSSQGIALLMQANLWENYDLAEFGPNSAELVHRMVEAKKLAFADRDAYVCDPGFYPVPVERMLSKTEARARLDRIDPGRAAQGYAPRDFTAGGEDTVYLAVVDGQGNAVSLVQSIYESFGSCLMEPETGIILHNRARGFSLDSEHPNRVEPGKRPYHTLHSAMVLKDGQPYMIMGSPGADGQTQIVSQMTVNFLDFKANVQEVCEAPRWRSNPDGTLILEKRFSQATMDGLKAKGHKILVTDGWDAAMGSAQAIIIDRQAGVVMGGADPRRQAYAIGK